jgi:hypothetical protein
LFTARTIVVVTAGLGLAFALFVPFTFLVFTVPGVLVGRWAWRQRERVGSPLLVIYVTSLVFTFAAVFVDAFVEPVPLSDVSIRLQSGGTLTGHLVVQRTESWVVTQKSRTFRVVPADQVIAATVTQPPRARRNSLYQVLTGNPSFLS